MRPGHFLETRFLQPLGLTQEALARIMGISRRRVNELVRGKRAITPDTALRLALIFDLEPAFWLGLQMQWDLYRECLDGEGRRLRGVSAPWTADR